jgi:hypothetical protein
VLHPPVESAIRSSLSFVAHSLVDANARRATIARNVTACPCGGEAGAARPVLPPQSSDQIAIRTVFQGPFLQEICI